jgi:hypothetical protein
MIRLGGKKLRAPFPAGTLGYLAVLLSLFWAVMARSEDGAAAPAAAEVRVSTENPVALDADTLEMVKEFLKLPADKLPLEFIPRFLAVDPASLPRKLRRPFEARKLELYSLKQLQQTKKKGIVLLPDDHCEAPKEAKSQDFNVLRMAGYKEITEEEDIWLTKRTRCTEQDMLCNFSLQILNEKVGSGRQARMRRRYFLYCWIGCDPLMALVEIYRAHADDSSTNFFGSGGGPVCSR